MTKKSTAKKTTAKKTTREHLIDVGLQRIRSTGYAATGVKEILDLAEVPKGSFYHYFPSKEAFAEEVLQSYGAGEAQRWESILGDIKVAPLRRLRRYFDDLASVYEDQINPVGGCLLGNLSIEVAEHSPKLQSLLSGAFGYWQKAVAAVLHEAVQRGDLSPSTKPDDLAAFLINSWEGALVRMKAERSSNPIHTFIHFTFSVVLKR
ncbi:MAG TPA: TetR family transcriptional regulator C-terminal domain-containing protein [Edaphobacter sp.]|nr:TetR family transcriptional regulator C-terminal domain-containing protein [Edaphobacter sp.]